MASAAPPRRRGRHSRKARQFCSRQFIFENFSAGFYSVLPFYHTSLTKYCGAILFIFHNPMQIVLALAADAFCLWTPYRRSCGAARTAASGDKNGPPAGCPGAKAPSTTGSLAAGLNGEHSRIGPEPLPKGKDTADAVSFPVLWAWGLANPSAVYTWKLRRKAARRPGPRWRS